ncbi:MAG TPA: alpha/beta fold hydrolase [Nocardioides sp.]|nr:alpha/beta fold hydrolase [Nocardioides sp.]
MSVPGPVQQIRFCRAPDGVRIAYAVSGTGPPLLVSTCWLSHLQHDWESPVWRHFLDDIGRFVTIIRYDERGYGLSDWDVTDFSLEARVGDLEAVAEDAGFERFALMGMAQGGPPAITYATRHPERVTRLLFYGSHAGAMATDADDEEELEAFAQLIKVGWGRPEHHFRRVFTSLMIPGATEEQMRWLDELQRVAASATTASTALRERSKANCLDLLPDLDLPTLVLHSLGDQMSDFEHARLLANRIPGARLVPLDSGNHIVLGDEPAWPVFVDEVREFVAPDGTPAPQADGLSPREREVLALVAEGRSNDEIAAGLCLSVRTVERHLANSYTKLGLHGPSARAAAAATLART